MSLHPWPGKSASIQDVLSACSHKIWSNRESSWLITLCCLQARTKEISGRQWQQCFHRPTLKPLRILCLKVENNELSLCDSSDVRRIVPGRNSAQSVCPSASITWHILFWLPRLQLWSKHKQLRRTTCLEICACIPQEPVPAGKTEHTSVTD